MSASHRTSSSLTLHLEGAQLTGGGASSSLPSSSSVLALASVRIYHSDLGARDDEWTSSKLQGTLSFGRNWGSGSSSRTGAAQSVSDGQYWFSLADKATGKTIWMLQIPSAFVYEVDRPFFHVFNGRTRKYGFLFEDDDEASIFSSKVANETCSTVGAPKRSRATKARGIKEGSKGAIQPRSKSFGARISRAFISLPAPNSFRHIAHISVDSDGVFKSSSGVDPSFKEVLVQLQPGSARAPCLSNDQRSLERGCDGSKKLSHSSWPSDEILL